MVWEPFALAVMFGLLISAGLYFVVMWPQVAPDDDAPEAAPIEAATVETAAPAPGDAATDAPLADATDAAAATDAPAAVDADAPTPA